jgi:hypothetical protein
MDSPNRIANMNSGTKLTMGIACGRPTRPAPQPFWKTAVTTP